jgi:Ca2+-binding EF-hand superfamily protein
MRQFAIAVPRELSEEQHQEIHEAFDWFGIDGSGH